MALQQQHAHLLSYGGLFDLGLMAEALYNYKEIRTPTGLKCDYLQLDCWRGSAVCAKAWPATW